MSEVLKGHYSPATAYVVNDYPYGFRLRCKIRYWVEYVRNRGCRMVSQTTNPKVAGEVWNKPKASTYYRFGLVMGLDDKGHVINLDQCSEYSDCQQCVDFAKAYADALPCDEARDVLDRWVKAKLALERAKEEGKVTLNIRTTTYDGNMQPVTSTVRSEVLQPEGVKL